MTLLTRQEIETLLDGTTPGPWRAEGEPWNRIVWSSAENRVCFMAHSSGLDDDRDVATSNLAAAAPDLARTALDALARLEDAEAAQALVVERAGEYVAQNSLSWRFSSPWHGKDFQKELLDLANPSGVEALAALRAERGGLLTTWAESRERHLKAEAERDDLRARLAVAEGRVAALTEALHRISLGSQNSATSKDAIGKEARAALATVTPPADTTEGRT